LCGINVGIYLNSNMRRSSLGVKNVGTVLNVVDPEFNDKFVRWRETELLNDKHPDKT